MCKSKKALVNLMRIAFTAWGLDPFGTDFSL